MRRPPRSRHVSRFRTTSITVVLTLCACLSARGQHEKAGRPASPAPATGISVGTVVVLKDPDTLVRGDSDHRAHRLRRGTDMKVQRIDGDLACSSAGGTTSTPNGSPSTRSSRSTRPWIISIRAIAAEAHGRGPRCGCAAGCWAAREESFDRALAKLDRALRLVPGSGDEPISTAAASTRNRGKPRPGDRRLCGAHPARPARFAGLCPSRECPGSNKGDVGQGHRRRHWGHPARPEGPLGVPGSRLLPCTEGATSANIADYSTRPSGSTRRTPAPTPIRGDAQVARRPISTRPSPDYTEAIKLGAKYAATPTPGGRPRRGPIRASPGRRSPITPRRSRLQAPERFVPLFLRSRCTGRVRGITAGPSPISRKRSGSTQKDPMSLRKRGVLLAPGDPTKAIADFNEAKIAPNDASAYSHRGDSRAAKRDHDRAIADYDFGLIRLDPKRTSPLYASRGDARAIRKGDLSTRPSPTTTRPSSSMRNTVTPTRGGPGPGPTSKSCRRRSAITPQRSGSSRKTDSTTACEAKSGHASAIVTGPSPTSTRPSDSARMTPRAYVARGNRAGEGFPAGQGDGRLSEGDLAGSQGDPGLQRPRPDLEEERGTRQGRRQYRRTGPHGPEIPDGHRESPAWLLATCDRDALRDGRRAVTEANAACEARPSGRTSKFASRAMAAACAEVGDFDSAVKWQTRALEISTAKNGRLDPFNKIQQDVDINLRLSRYKRRGTFRERSGGAGR